jgi:hypothetical protein
VTLSACGLGDYPEIKNMPFIARFTTFHFNNSFELDVMTDLKGFKNSAFDSCLQAASVAEIEGISIPFLHINHLIAEKEATSRPKDQIDLLEPKKIRDSGV